MPAFHLHAGLAPQREAYLTETLAQGGLQTWLPIAAQRWQHPGHGDFARWRDVVQTLPAHTARHTDLRADRLVIGADNELDDPQQARLRQGLEALIPWRKGPFSVCGAQIDAEWRSDMKWNRILPHISDLQGRQILDVGCSNGYYLLRMAGQGARFALGIEPGWLANWQFAALARFLPADFPAWMIPAPLEALPAAAFDSVFSMGVLHHRRDPQEHLRQLRAQLRPGGELILETLISERTPASGILDIQGRYASMRNVWMLMHPDRILQQLGDAGFLAPRCIDCSATTSDEQRTTNWMPFHSLQDALDPQDPTRTKEGHPAPMRAIFIADG